MGIEWSAWGKKGEPPAFHEKAYSRSKLADWDARYRLLSSEARRCLVEVIKVPPKEEKTMISRPTVPTTALSDSVRNELVVGGFVVVQTGVTGGRGERLAAGAGSRDFLKRMRALSRFELLWRAPLESLRGYIRYTSYDCDTIGELNRVLDKAGVRFSWDLDAMAQDDVSLHQWPGWVAGYLGDPLAERMVEELRLAGEPVPRAEFESRFADQEPKAIIRSLDDLITRLAVFEGLRAESWELMVGFLPSVREGFAGVGVKRERPGLVACASPRELAPEGMQVVDLRALLLEIASEPPRLKQDFSLFRKEEGRFEQVLDPSPEWLEKLVSWANPADRLSEAIRLANRRGLIRANRTGKEIRLELSEQGREWLAAGMDAQRESLFRDEYDSRAFAPDTREKRVADLMAAGVREPEGVLETQTRMWVQEHDARFLGMKVCCMGRSKNRDTSTSWGAILEDLAALRAEMERAFGELEAGVYYHLESVIDHMVFEGDNPLNLGRPMEEVAVFAHGRMISPVMDHRVKAGRELVKMFVRKRLLPLGCVRAGVDEGGSIVIATRPALASYFGRRVAAEARAEGEPGVSKVIVQPDFSVIVIGLDTAPACELAPMCDRSTRSVGHGSMVLKLTRESVTRAISHGIAGEEIVARLKRHASNELPPNVLKEVEEWSGWVKKVSYATLRVLRCPDRATADRVVAALKGRAELIGETLVAIELVHMNSAERKRLGSQGILVEMPAHGFGS